MDESAENSILHGEIDKRVQFVTKHLAFGESHMVDFFVWDHWHTLIHPDVQTQLLQCDENDLFSVKRMCSRHGFTNAGSKSNGKYAIQDLKAYFEEAESCAVENSHVCISLGELEQQFCKTSSTPETGATKLLNTKEYMCNKKSHEVDVMSHLVNLICWNFKLSRVLDLGAGKGYLGTYLSLKYGLEVIGVDCSASNSSGALLRSKKFLKYWNAHLKNKTEDKLQESALKYEPLTVRVDADTDINSVFGGGDVDNPVACENGLMLTALHACGDLSSTALRTFVGRNEVKATCVVGCCYHILTSNETHESEQGFPMSSYLRQKNFTLQRNTRMLGLKALARTETTDTTIMEEKSTRSLFYRAVLSVILEKEFGMDSSTKELRVGKEYSKSKNFTDYVRRCFKRLKLPEEKCNSVSDESIESYFQLMGPRRKSLLAFNILREAFGPAVEALILLDKLLYLKEQKLAPATLEGYLVRLFDPIKSPRCYAIVATKK